MPERPWVRPQDEAAEGGRKPLRIVEPLADLLKLIAFGFALLMVFFISVDIFEYHDDGRGAESALARAVDNYAEETKRSTDETQKLLKTVSTLMTRQERLERREAALERMICRK